MILQTFSFKILSEEIEELRNIPSSSIETKFKMKEDVKQQRAKGKGAEDKGKIRGQKRGQGQGQGQNHKLIFCHNLNQFVLLCIGNKLFVINCNSICVKL